MKYLSLFRMPTPMKITGHTSNITNAFFNSIIPVVPPSAEEAKQALEILNTFIISFLHLQTLLAKPTALAFLPDPCVRRLVFLIRRSLP